MMNFTFTLTEQEAVVIIGTLAKRPYEETFELIHKLQAQAQEQAQTAQAAQVAGDE